MIIMHGTTSLKLNSKKNKRMLENKEIGKQPYVWLWHLVDATKNYTLNKIRFL